MPRRAKRSQSKHDVEVRRIAKDLKDKGYEVQADIRGHSRPDTIGGLRPDVIARKGIERKIVEVETSESRSTPRDLKQQRAFRQAANRSKNTTFRRVIVKTEDD
ncbi:MAG: hypothetical protein FVQ81_09585 [Candidatus Glassbacteria bacterium]|nr:hypothetical protein [Candidatus Glassbacteria bacterium]